MARGPLFLQLACRAMPDPWTSQASVSSGGPVDRVTLVEGSAFLITAPGGEVAPESAEGFFFRDTRFLSAWVLRINGDTPEPLARSVADPYSATFVSRSRPHPGRSDSNLMIERRRYVGRGMREDLMVRNFGEEPAYCAVEIAFGADFADLFAVKESRVGSRSEEPAEHIDGSIVFARKNGTHRRSLRVSFSEPAVARRPHRPVGGDHPREGDVDSLPAVLVRHRRRRDRAEMAVRPARGPGQAGRAHGGLAAQRPGCRHRPRRPADGGGEERRGPRRVCGSSIRTTRSGRLWPPAPPGS